MKIVGDIETAKKITEHFNIPIDESRIQDYIIQNAKLTGAAEIELTDTKNDITYTASYSNNATLLNYMGGKIQFLNLTVVNHTIKIENCYYIGNDNPIISRVTFTDKEYGLVFEKEIPNLIHNSTNNGIKFSMDYFKNMIYEGQNVQQQLLTKIFKETCNCGENFDFFERLCTYGMSRRYIQTDNEQDKYVYSKNNNIFYGINRFEIKNICRYFRGICFERTDVPNVGYYMGYYLRNILFESKNIPFADEKYISAIVLKGGTGEVNKHSLEIYKYKCDNKADNQCSIQIRYHIEKCFYRNGHNKDVEILEHQDLEYPAIAEGNITSIELRNIIKMLQAKYNDDKFITIASDELETFAHKIDIKNGVVQEELDPLSLKLLMDKSFEEIYAMVSANKEEYFRLAAEQFEAATNIAQSKDNMKTKVAPDSNSY